MTIESQIADLTAAVNKLADVFTKYATAAGGEVLDQLAYVAPLPPLSLEQISKKLDEPELAPKTEKKEPKPKAEKAKPAEEPKAEAVVEYSAVRDKVLDLIKADPNNRAKVLSALEQFGVTTAKELKPEQYAEALQKLNDIKVA